MADTFTLPEFEIGFSSYERGREIRSSKSKINDIELAYVLMNVLSITPMITGLR